MNKFSIEGLITPIGSQNTQDLSEKIDKIWNDDNIGLNNDSYESKMLHDLNLEHISSSVIGLLAEKLFSQGVQIDVKIPENLTIKGRSEELEQILYHLINYSINSTSEFATSKNISIFAHRLGDIVAFDLNHSGHGFDKDILKQRVGISKSEKSLDIDLQICQTLITEIEAKLQLDNKLDQKGEIIGGRVKIIFKAGASASAQLVNLKVGTKKDILASLNQSRELNLVD